MIGVAPSDRPSSDAHAGDRLIATYRLSGPAAEAPSRAQAIAVEQSIEFPAELATTSIRENVVGRVESVIAAGESLATVQISYSTDITGGELPQLLIVLFGNCSMYPGVRLMNVQFPLALLERFRGPRFGLDGLRHLLRAPRRPILATALKPLGSSPAAFARMASTLASAGVDLIKEDQSLANQSFARFASRVRACADAVGEANARSGATAIYLPVINAPAEAAHERAVLAKDAGAGGLLVLPGVIGFDAMRAMADDPRIGLPLMAHPTLLGSFVTDDKAGIDHGFLFGTLMRLSGADACAFPSFGGRFSFSPADCRAIAAGCLRPLGQIAPILPAAGGGMTLDLASDTFDFYGRDIALLIGGSLHRGDLAANAKAIRGLAERFGT